MNSTEPVTNQGLFTRFRNREGRFGSLCGVPAPVSGQRTRWRASHIQLHQCCRAIFWYADDGVCEPRKIIVE